MAYRYWKKEVPRNSRWTLIEDTPDKIEEALEAGAHFLSTPALSEPYDENGSEPTRYGSMVLDFDSQDPGKVLAETRKFVSGILADAELDPGGLRYFASGGKGYHIEIPAGCFGAQDGDPYLPSIYRECAKHWAKEYTLETLDLGIYNMRRGRMFRICNAPRENGRYKVQLSHSELMSLSASEIADLTLQPRSEICGSEAYLNGTSQGPTPEVDHAPTLSKLFSSNQAAVHQRVEMRGRREKARTVDRAVHRTSISPPPTCIRYILEVQPHTEQLTFNISVMHLITWAQESGYRKDQALSLFSEFLDSYPHSTKYTTAPARRGHFDSQWDYFAGSAEYTWSCDFMQALRLPISCQECPENPMLWAMEPAPKKPFYEMTDLGNSERFVDRYGHLARFCAVWKKWLIWDGRRWKIDTVKRVREFAKDMPRVMLKESSNILKDDIRDAYVKWARHSQTKARIDAFLELASSDGRVAVHPDDLDAQPHLFNTLNCTINLETFEVEEHNKAHLLTQLAPVEFDSEAECPLFMEQLALCMAGNAENIEFLRRAVGCELSGDASERMFVVLWGDGRNGKTTFLEVLRGILGDYCRAVPAETLLAGERRGRIPNDIAGLHGVRLVYCSETNEDRWLDEGRIKMLSGNESYPARFLFGEFFEVRRQFHFWLDTNFRPRIRGTDKGI